ncbi:MAG: hypothetical protein Q8N63_01010 [Nanoarchaeota archaeon]|nr:hypothetical protein [Nanoarchaeota archaeon]
MKKRDSCLNEPPKKMNLLTRILGTAVLATTLVITCGCESYKPSNQLSPTTYYFEQYNYPEHMRQTLTDPVPPKNSIYPGPELR